MTHRLFDTLWTELRSDEIFFRRTFTGAEIPTRAFIMGSRFRIERLPNPIHINLSKSIMTQLIYSWFPPTSHYLSIGLMSCLTETNIYDLLVTCWCLEACKNSNVKMLIGQLSFAIGVYFPDHKAIHFKFVKNREIVALRVSYSAVHWISDNRKIEK